jgi:uncharacterized membrane protein (UPF0127 family)
MNKKFLIVVSALFVLFTGHYILNNKYFLTKKADENGKGPAKTILISGNKLYIDVADTQDEREKGLSVKESLNDNEGMLFDFGAEDIYPAFWMKDMVFAIDIIWIDNGEVVGIEKNVPPPTAENERLKMYYPPKTIDYVLEVKGGYCDRNGIKEGDLVDLSKI